MFLHISQEMQVGVLAKILLVLIEFHRRICATCNLNTNAFLIVLLNNFYCFCTSFSIPDCYQVDSSFFTIFNFYEHKLNPSLADFFSDPSSQGKV